MPSQLVVLHHLTSLPRIVKQDDPAITDAYLKDDWEAGSDLLVSYVESRTDTWTALQVWGFAEVDGVRKHVRRVFSKKGSQEQRVKLVYDFKSE